MNKPKAVIADDEEFVRDFFKSVLESINYNVIAEVERGDELVGIMTYLQPDILLLDINMPGLKGTEFLKEYSQDFPGTCIIILTSSALSTLIDETSLAKAKCFLRKDTPLNEMIEAIKYTWSQFKKEHR